MCKAPAPTSFAGATRPLDQLLPLVPAVPQGLAILLGPDQHLQVRYGSFYANANLRPDVAAPAPIVTLELASQLVAWACSAHRSRPSCACRVGFQISLAQVPALQGLAPSGGTSIA